MQDFLSNELAQVTHGALRFLDLSFIGYPLLAFLSLFVTGYVVLYRQRVARGKSLSVRLFLRAFLSKGMIFRSSGRVDVALLVLNSTVFPVLFGWMMISGQIFVTPTVTALTHLLGSHAPPQISAGAQAFLATLALFIAYEFGYWVDHYLSHRIPVLWHFHKVHHTATSLSIVTVHRVHPIDTVVFGGILALTGGVTAGCLEWAFAAPFNLMEIGSTNLFLFAAMIAYIPLQHSGVWLAFTGAWGRVFLSPAHHQLHHANDPTLYGSNLGSCLSVFDWMFGTLKIPSAEPQKLTFGVSASDHPPVGILDHVVQPFLDAGRTTSSTAPAPLAKAS